MPNWCENSLRVTGAKKDISELKKYLAKGKTEFEFMMIMPPPDGVWDYNWCIENWSTKWEPDYVLADWSPTDATIDMSTAWGPPKGLVRHLSSMFGKLVFELRYAEGGMDFSGIITFEKGLYHEKEGTYGEYYGDMDEDEDEDDPV